MTAFQAVSQEMYNAANAQNGAQGGAQAGPDFNSQSNSNNTAEDVDFEEVK